MTRRGSNHRREVRKSKGNNPQSDSPHKTTVAHFSRTYMGELPPPEMLREFEQIHPGITEQLLDMVKSERDHRQFVEKTQVAAESRGSLMGQIIGFTTVILIVALAFYMVYSKYGDEVPELFGWALVSIIGIFVTGKIVSAIKSKSE